MENIKRMIANSDGRPVDTLCEVCGKGLFDCGTPPRHPCSKCGVVNYCTTCSKADGPPMKFYCKRCGWDTTGPSQTISGMRAGGSISVYQGSAVTYGANSPAQCVGGIQSDEGTAVCMQQIGDSVQKVVITPAEKKKAPIPMDWSKGNKKQYCFVVDPKNVDELRRSQYLYRVDAVVEGSPSTVVAVATRNSVCMIMKLVMVAHCLYDVEK